MKTIFAAAALALVSLTAWGVSLDFINYSAVEIGEIETVVGEENTETTVEFSGRGLLPLFQVLPTVYDIEIERDSQTIRGFDVFSMGDDGVTKKINVQCVKEGASAKCRITITKGIIAG